MMRIENTKLGDVEFEDERVITFPEGLPGFSDSRRFALLEIRRGKAFKWLLSLDRPELALVVADPFAFFPGYEAPLEEKELAALAYRENDLLAVLAVVTVRGRRKKDTTFNLRAPVVVNMRTLTGKQVVLKEEKWGLQARLPLIAPSPSGAKEKRPAASL
ncbi:MAG: flagellar assembly protein FliW [Deltaproteobacteria bacterium]|nr:flagellar assembly protein FliW [Deltaproteobacteria bacterium]